MSLRLAGNKLRTSTVVNFGKYKGETLKAIYDLDPKYFLWLLTKTDLSKKKHGSKIYKLIHGHDTCYGQCRTISEDWREPQPSQEYTRHYAPTDDDNVSL